MAGLAKARREAGRQFYESGALASAMTLVYFLVSTAMTISPSWANLCLDAPMLGMAIILWVVHGGFLLVTLDSSERKMFTETDEEE